MKRKYTEPEIEVIKLNFPNVLNISLKEDPNKDLYQKAEDQDFDW